MSAMSRRSPRALPLGAGFTLIEIMVVVVILGILAALVAPNVIRRIDDANVAKAKQDIRAFETALNLFRMDNFKYPTTDQGLQALVVPAQRSDHPQLEARRLPERRRAQGSLGQRLSVCLPRGAWPRVRPLYARRRRSGGRRRQQRGHRQLEHGLRPEGPVRQASCVAPGAKSAEHRAASFEPECRATDALPSRHLASGWRLAARRSRARGFTLLEILVVVVIIGIMVAAATLSVGVLGADRRVGG